MAFFRFGSVTFAFWQDWEGQADSDEDDDEWAAGIGSNSENTASQKNSLMEDSIAMSLNSQLSVSEPVSALCLPQRCLAHVVGYQ